VAKKKRRKRRSVSVPLLFIITPLLVWLVAFVLWFYWNDIATAFANRQSKGKVPRTSASPSESPPGLGRAGNHRPEEKISDEDRKKLEEILEKR
jgi:hypothetical protein